mgnify:FL=1
MQSRREAVRMVSSIAAVAHEQLLLVACTEAHVADLAVWASVRDTHTRTLTQ